MREREREKERERERERERAFLAERRKVQLGLSVGRWVGRAMCSRQTGGKEKYLHTTI